MTVVVNGLGPKAKFQGKNLKSKVDFYLFLSFIPIHFFSPCYISITSQFYRQHSLVKPGRMQKDWAGMSRLSIQFSSQMSNFFACFTGPFNRMAYMHLGMLWTISLSCTSCASKSSLHKQCYTQGNLGNNTNVVAPSKMSMHFSSKPCSI